MAVWQICVAVLSMVLGGAPLVAYVGGLALRGTCSAWGIRLASLARAWWIFLVAEIALSLATTVVVFVPFGVLLVPVVGIVVTFACYSTTLKLSVGRTLVLCLVHLGVSLGLKVVVVAILFAAVA